MSSEDISDVDVLLRCLEGKECCPTDLLSMNDKASVLHSLAQFVTVVCTICYIQFVTEARPHGGKPYPPKTIHMLII